MAAVILFIGLFVGIVLYFNIKNKYQAKHPKKCDFCGKEFPNPKKLADGFICEECMKVEYGDEIIDLSTLFLNTKKKAITVAEVREYASSLRERGQIAKGFTATRKSPSDLMSVDDNLGLFLAESRNIPKFARRISDIEGFRLVMDRNWTESATDTVSIEGGHIEITLRELSDTLIVSIPVDSKLFGMKEQVKKTYEAELEFLEAVTGKVRE